MSSQTRSNRRHKLAWLTVTSILLTGWLLSPVQAQLPLLPDLNQQAESLLNSNSGDKIVSSCIWLDGRCIFQVAAQKSLLPGRKQEIQQNLTKITRKYFQQEAPELQVGIKEENRLPVIFVNGERLVTITEQDADQQGEEDRILAAQVLSRSLKWELQRAKQERKPQFLARRGGIAAGTGVVMLVACLAISGWEKRLKRSKKQVAPSDASPPEPISTQLTYRQQWNLREVQHRLLQLAQAGVVAAGSLLILSLFPYTRIAHVVIISFLRIPLRVGVVALGTYVVIRLSYAFIARLNSTIVKNSLLASQANQRLQLRVVTISAVTRSIVTASWIAIGVIVALTVVGIDIGPLLAGAGIIGIAVSLAAQNLIKDAINGFCIILEDQYAVGDVINVGDVGGLVENINLRITQVRDAEGRLITIPNSEIRIVANLSSNWSRADLIIPVAYHTDIDKALELVNLVAKQMMQHVNWRSQILEPPQVLGVDNFEERGLIIRVWIKTKPLKQWEISREFRRRLKVAFDQAEIAISLSRQELWLSQSFSSISSLEKNQGEQSPN